MHMMLRERREEEKGIRSRGRFLAVSSKKIASLLHALALFVLQ
jgi:hypothetical protein